MKLDGIKYTEGIIIPIQRHRHGLPLTWLCQRVSLKVFMYVLGGGGVIVLEFVTQPDYPVSTFRGCDFRCKE